MLWHVEESQLALLGSVHLLDDPNPPLSAAAWRAFSTSKRVVFEHDFSQQPDVSFARLPSGQSLRGVIPTQLLDAVQERCRELGLNVDFVTAQQPWFAAMIVASAMAKRAGFDHLAGVDRKLFEQARQQGKAIEFLEDTSAALRTFSTAPVEEQLTMLRFAALDPVAANAFMGRLVDGWKQRRADLILACIQERIALMPQMQVSIIENRNRAWLPRLCALAEGGGRTLAVVGVLHALGAVGLPALLRAAGYNVTPVDVSGE